MIVEISMWLFGKPAWEMDIEGREIDSSRMFREKGIELKTRLEEIAEIVDKLLENKWTISGGLYDLWATKENTIEEAEKELKGLGINPEYYNLQEIDGEEEE